MRGQDHIVPRQEFLQHRVLNFLPGQIHPDELSFLIVNIAGKACNFPGFEAVQNSLKINESASCGIDEVNTVLHLRDRLAVDHLPCCVVQHAVEEQKIRFPEHLVLCRIGHIGLCLFPFMRRACENRTAHCVKDLGGFDSELAGSEESQRHGAELFSLYPMKSEVLMGEFLLHRLPLPHECQHQEHRELRHCIRAVYRNIGCPDTIFLNGFPVNLIVTGGSRQDVFDAGAVQTLRNFPGNLARRHNQDGVCTVGKRCVVPGQILRRCHDIQIVSLFPQLLQFLLQKRNLIRPKSVNDCLAHDSSSRRILRHHDGTSFLSFAETQNRVQTPPLCLDPIVRFCIPVPVQ